MMIFVYTFISVLVALVVILGVGSLLGDEKEEPVRAVEGKATAAMCTTRLLETADYSEDFAEDDFVIEQDLVYTYDSLNLA
ncbi:hypothetical protein [Butyrivibrio sp. VCB2006]|uniref:hypothetical protein n=1 Tax=Butyrivibrio sp. VCB2006 TaxID=1280679 RepID=UPI0004922A6B|nr:hypothetical protein [Butyrivibrio sp. VCB2006]